MDPLRIIEDLDGFFTTAQAREVGYDHKAIAWQVRHGVWHRVRRGYFVWLLRPGQDAGDVVFAEKQREDRLRELTGFAMVRLVWSDLNRPRLTARRVERLLRRAG